MKTEITEQNGKFRGEVYYDAECPICMKGFMRFSGLFTRHGFRWLPMQAPGLAIRLNIPDEELRREMKLLRADGQLLGGIDTWSFLLRSIWWLWPLGAILKIPGIHGIANATYLWFARNRYCFGGRCALPEPRSSRREKAHSLSGEGSQSLLTSAATTSKPFFTPLELVLCAALPMLAGLLAWKASAWVFMWSVAVAMGFTGKWLTFRDALHHGARPTFSRFAIWFLGWPGLDGRAFFKNALPVAKPERSEWLWAVGKLIIGLGLVWHLAPMFSPNHPLLAGWTAMIGIILILHFGTFHLLSVIWRTCGIDAQPIMRSPLRSTSLGELWGLRWNTAFSIPSRRLMLAPLARKLGTIKASFLIFLLSGLLHELVVSLPARGGFGLPTGYFVLQGVGILLQSTKTARRYGWERGHRGWIFTVIFAALPAYWLFHPPFIRHVILPMLQAIGAN